MARLDSVKKEIERLNDIITIDDKFNHLYIREVLEDELSSHSSTEYHNCV